MTDHVLILGSAPNAVEAAQWDHTLFDRIVVINNAWRVRSDWDILIHPDLYPDAWSHMHWSQQLLEDLKTYNN